MCWSASPGPFQRRRGILLLRTLALLGRPRPKSLLEQDDELSVQASTLTLRELRKTAVNRLGKPNRYFHFFLHAAIIARVSSGTVTLLCRKSPS